VLASLHTVYQDCVLIIAMENESNVNTFFIIFNLHCKILFCQDFVNLARIVNIHFVKAYMRPQLAVSKHLFTKMKSMCFCFCLPTVQPKHNVALARTSRFTRN